MFIIILFGLGMISLGSYMTAYPLKFSAGIVSFSEKRWFHTFEVLSRLIVGLLFLVAANKTSFEFIVTVLGYLLCFTSIFLVVIGAKRHRKFALLISRIGQHFRILGIFAIILGSGIIYLGVS